MNRMERFVASILYSPKMILLFVVAIIILSVVVSGVSKHAPRSNSPYGPQTLAATPRPQVNEADFQDVVRAVRFNLAKLQGDLTKVLADMSDIMVSYERLDRSMKEIQDAVALNKQKLVILRVPRHMENKRNEIVNKLEDIEDQLINIRALVASGDKNLVRTEINQLSRELDRIIMGF